MEPLANHDILYVGNLTGFAAKSAKAVKLAGEFLNTRVQDWPQEVPRTRVFVAWHSYELSNVAR